MRKYLFYIIILSIVTFAAVSDSSADMLILNSGQEYRGTISKISGDSVTISVGDDETVFKKSDLLRIEFAKTTPKDKTISLSDIDDALLTETVSKRVSQADYLNAGHVTLLDQREYTLTPDGQFQSKVRNISQILKERGKNSAVVMLHFRQDTSKAEILHGRTVNENDVYDYDQTSLRETSLYYRYPDYDLVKKISFPLPNIVVGSIYDYSYRVTQEKIDTFDPILKRVYFASSEPILTRRVILRFPKSEEGRVNVALKNMGKEGTDYTHKREVSGDNIVITYEVRDIEALESESYMPSYDMIMPKLTISISPTFGKITSEYSASLKERVVISSEIKAKVAELISDSKSVEGDIFNIFRYIVKEIEQVPVSFTQYNSLPKSSDLIFSKKSGNNLEKTFLFYTLLQAADIPCELALVRSRNSGEVINDTPNLKQFRSPVVVIPLEMTTLYITALNKNLRTVDIDGSIQGGSGLIVSSEGGELINIPQNAADKENSSSKYVIDLNEDGSIRVRETKRVNGNNQGSFRMFQYMPKKRLDKYFLSTMHNKHPNAELESYEFKNLDDLTKLPEMELKYNIKDYMITAGGKLFAFQLPSISYSASGVGKDERKYPLNFGNLMSRNSEYIINLPKNYKIYYLPEGKSYKSDIFAYNASFKVEGRKVTFTDSYERHESYAEKEVYFDLKECLEARAAVSKEWIVIEKE